MPLYLILFLAFIVQEPISSGTVMLEAYQQHYSIWLMHLLFILATVLDCLIGYNLGMYVKRRFAGSKTVRYAERHAETMMRHAGKYGKKIMLVIFGSFLFPVSPFITPWLDVSFSDTLVYLSLGELLFYYAPDWLLVLGVKSSVVSPVEALYAIAGASLIVAFLLRYMRKGGMKAK